jgi:hypothetical protein
VGSSQSTQTKRGKSTRQAAAEMDKGVHAKCEDERAYETDQSNQSYTTSKASKQAGRQGGGASNNGIDMYSRFINPKAVRKPRRREKGKGKRERERDGAECNRVCFTIQLHTGTHHHCT